MIDRLTPRSAILVAAVFILLVGLIGWFVFVSPQRSEAASLGVQISEMEVRLALAQRVINGDDPEERRVQLQRLRIAMPPETGMAEILREVSAAARASRVRINGVTPSAPAAAGGAQAIPISLNVDGIGTDGIRNFLERLRSQAEGDAEKMRASGRLYSVDSISFGASGSVAKEPAAITATISLNAFSYTAAPPAAPPAAPTTPPESPETNGSAAGANG